MKKAALALLALFIATKAGTTTAPREQLPRLFVACLIASTDTTEPTRCTMRGGTWGM